MLIIGYRNKNFDDGFLQICGSLCKLELRFIDVHFVYSMYLNLNVQQWVLSLLTGLHTKHIIAPLDFEPSLYLLKHAHLVLTDIDRI